MLEGIETDRLNGDPGAEPPGRSLQEAGGAEASYSTSAEMAALASAWSEGSEDALQTATAASAAANNRDNAATLAGSASGRAA
jgi:hypothetical protein